MSVMQPDTFISALPKYSSMGKHLLKAHGDKNPLNEGLGPGAKKDGCFRRLGPVLCSQEVPREIGRPRLRNAIHQRSEA